MTGYMLVIFVVEKFDCKTCSNANCDCIKNLKISCYRLNLQVLFKVFWYFTKTANQGFVQTANIFI